MRGRQVLLWFAPTVAPFGSTGTRISGIDDNRAIVGCCQDRKHFIHDFVRRAGETAIETFDPPVDTNPVGINRVGDIAGWYVDAGRRIW
jgi:hypothetical protein